MPVFTPAGGKSAPLRFRTSRVYDLLFRAAAETLIMIAADPKASGRAHRPHRHPPHPGLGALSDFVTVPAQAAVASHTEAALQDPEADQRFFGRPDRASEGRLECGAGCDSSLCWVLAPGAKPTLSCNTLRLSWIRSRTILAASAVVFVASSAKSRVFCIATSKAFLAYSLCLATISCGLPVGRKSFTIFEVSLKATSTISRCFSTSAFAPSPATDADRMRASKFLRFISTSLSTSTLGSPSLAPKALIWSRNEF